MTGILKKRSCAPRKHGRYPLNDEGVWADECPLTEKQRLVKRAATEQAGKN